MVITAKDTKCTFVCSVTFRTNILCTIHNLSRKTRLAVTYPHHRGATRPVGIAGSENLDSCAIIVTEANELTKGIHDRMPVILAPEAYNSWMDPDLTDFERLKAFLKPYPSERLMAYPVSATVNNPKNDEPGLITRAEKA